MFDLKYASLALRKVAWMHGIRVGKHNSYYVPYTDNEHGIKAKIGDNKSAEYDVTIFELEDVGQLTWAELRGD